MILAHFLLTVNEANAFLLGCRETREALLVDAGEYPQELDAVLESEGLRLTGVFITHDHFDHTDGLRDVLERHPAPVYAYQPETGGCEAHVVRQDDTVDVGRWTGRVLETPGHTPDGISLAFPGVVFSGDALFAGSIGGTASASLARTLVNHIEEQLFTLPPETEIYTGHGPASTVAIEKTHNPFFV